MFRAEIHGCIFIINSTVAQVLNDKYMRLFQENKRLELPARIPLARDQCNIKCSFIKNSEILGAVI